MICLLVDGDVLAYRAALSVEEALEVEPGYWTWYADYSKTISYIENTLEWMKRELKAEHFFICLSDDNHNFRKDILPEYKSFRQKLKRPLVLKQVRQYLKDKAGIIYTNLEGDDVMGIMHTDPYKAYDSIIVSIDKDMRTVPGKFYRDKLEVISNEEADYYHLYQTLIGDTTDGYGGCRGIGPKRAKELLDKSCTWDTVVKAYAKAGFDEEYALTQARCARILRYDDYNFETGEIRLWNP